MEELDLENLLNTLKDFDRGEQIILGNFGTVQTLLSLIFSHPVTVKLISQYEKEEVIIRRVQLMAENDVLCHAVSHIPKRRNRDSVISEISKGQMGLGQIIACHRLSSQRSLILVGEDDEVFWRTYSIEGPEVYIQIVETFIKAPLEAIGWIRSLSRVGVAQIK